jgi:hypothetical protein
MIYSTIAGPAVSAVARLGNRPNNNRPIPLQPLINVNKLSLNNKTPLPLKSVIDTGALVFLVSTLIATGVEFF